MKQDSVFNKIALDPHRSAVIEACAGSGKTWLLVSRVVRLLLDGVKPHEILAITFTRKAAQEMAARLNEWLQFLASATDDERRDFLRERSLKEDEIETLLLKAKCLFEESLIAQPSMTINTFHGWFLQLLQRAPLASGVSAKFSLIDQTSLLIEDAWQAFARRLRREEKCHIAFEYLLKKAGEFNTKKLLLNFIDKRAEWWIFTKGHRDSIAYTLSKLEQALSVKADTDYVADLFGDRSFIDRLNRLSLALKKGTPALVKIADEIGNTFSEESKVAFELVYKIFFTLQGAPKKNLLNFFEKSPEDKSAYDEVCRLLDENQKNLISQTILEFNRAGLICGVALLDLYQEVKAERQVMDFADVEWQAFSLLNESDYAAFMLHKLDNRYKHILIDEFQDTNPLQWQALLAWLNAYSSGETRPTVFLVGDPKQSIYRFRRADARLFDVAGEFLRKEYNAEYLTQNITRRNSPEIVDTVNRLFTVEKNFAHFVSHVALNSHLIGGAEVLPVVETTQTEALSSSGLRNPLQTALAESNDLQHQAEALQFAARIQEIVKGLPVVDEQRKIRHARYGDIMVLIRSRTHLAQYEMALRDAHIPYSSTRQGGLLHTLEVTDLVSLLEFLIMPFSDLRLAQTLRSPVFSCSDEDLMALARFNDGTWWQRLRQIVNDDSASAHLKRAYTLLENWVREVDTLPVHDLLDHIYYQSNLLIRYQAAVDSAMRASVKANLEAFMKLALTVDSGRYPSLPRFINELANLRSASLQEAPDEGKVEAIDDSTNVVRLSTIHGAKGLESPIVWILNTNSSEARPESYDVILNWIPGASCPDHFSLYSVKEERGACREIYFSAEQDYAEREDLNLLYVAITRAKQWLFISGSENPKAKDSWYTKINAVVQPSEISNPIFTDEWKQPDPPCFVASEEFKPLPVGIRRQSLYTAEQQRGILLHQLLEAATKGGRELSYLSWRNKLSAEEFNDLHDEAKKIIKAPHLQRFFDPKLYLNAWNEFAYANQEGEIRRIDRLVEFEEEIWILDYKMGAASYKGALYKEQLQEYTTAIRNLFPNKQVQAVLILSGGKLSFL